DLPCGDRTPRRRFMWSMPMSYKRNSEPNRPPRGDLASGPNLPLALLLDAYDEAIRVDRDLWEFALEMRVLLAEGVTAAVLRRLLCDGLVEHAIERTKPEATRRTFQRLHNLSLPNGACFVLTPAGVKTARKLGGGEGSSAQPAGIGPMAAVHRLVSRV